MSIPSSFWLTVLQICILAGLVCLGSANVQQHTCPDSSSLLYAPSCSENGARHDIAREQLLKSLDRNSGKWNKKHPRWQVLEALHGYDKYEKIVGAEIDRFENLYRHVPKKHKKILESTVNYKNNFDEARALLKINAAFCSKVFHFSLTYYNISRHELASFIAETDDGKPKSVIRTTVSQSLKHMVRDWSPEGHPEREATFPFILNALSTHLPPPPDNTKYSILVPGSGLGALAHEISLLGPYTSVTSNELSASMNMASRYLTSLPSSHGPITLHPFLESWSHARTRHELIHPVTIQPPTTPTETLLIEGDFTSKFIHSTGTFHAIATLFFIDTARNLVAYLETIHALLRPGGIWINVGPLLYGTAPLVQLSLEEIIAVAEGIGFDFEIMHHGEGEGGEESLGGKVEQREVLYNFNASTLYKHGYVAQCWVARKRGGGGGSGEEGRREVVGKGVFERLKEKLL
ncbi:putative carnosine N-methyltransferase, S-adenosyl-L-methionine-dependent methyltransferase [Septoria linicola]|nr:putative carnosine N-methyltransferase, S-adenosyl-L-methionine-dependent methyltransferase [Septoria linicola]